MADRGNHNFSYYIYPHAGDWKAANTVKAARELCTDIFVARDSGHAGKLPAAGKSFLSVEPANVVMSAFTPALDGNGYIVRCFESQGAGGTATVNLAVGKIGSAQEVDLLERPLGDKSSPAADSFTFPIGANEIKTYRVLFE